MPLRLVSLILFMGLQMILEQLLLAESQSTEWADAGRPPAVDLLMSPQGSRSGEALTAEVTAVWFDTSVTSHVRLHVLKRLSTNLTRPAAADGFSVRSEMAKQTF